MNSITQRDRTLNFPVVVRTNTHPITRDSPPVCQNFFNNNIADNCYSNVIGDDFRGNQIGNEFYDNNISLKKTKPLIYENLILETQFIRLNPLSSF